ncbi:MAG: hypothetical protein M1828_000079 [Chrysothrix sp. TS-e1954]|nr:MAG: hypothetical protein M1828_000079 [Chrysothrix sp. TS-e1954]
MAAFYSSSSKPHRTSSAPSNVYTRQSGSKASSSSFFGPSSHRGSSSSYYKRRSRDGYVSRIIEKMRHMLRQLYRYIRQNPVKVMLPLVMALVSGGALAAVLKKVGIKLPASVENAMGGGKRRGGYEDAFYGSQHPGGSGMDTGSMISGAMKIASAFV